jgi:hypothetical protein
LPPCGSVFELNDKGAQHLARVLRVAPGDELVVFDGKGKACCARVEECGRRGVTLLAGEQVASIPESALAVTLLQGISRSNRMDSAVRRDDCRIGNKLRFQPASNVVAIPYRMCSRQFRLTQPLQTGTCRQREFCCMPVQMAG